MNHVSKYAQHCKCVAALPCKMQMFESDKNCAQITIKLYYVSWVPAFVEPENCPPSIQT